MNGSLTHLWNVSMADHTSADDFITGVYSLCSPSTFPLEHFITPLFVSPQVPDSKPHYRELDQVIESTHHQEVSYCPKQTATSQTLSTHGLWRGCLLKGSSCRKRLGHKFSSSRKNKNYMKFSFWWLLVLLCKQTGLVVFFELQWLSFLWQGQKTLLLNITHPQRSGFRSVSMSVYSFVWIQLKTQI